MSTTGKWVSGMVLGGLIGGGVALLTASRSGEKTREMIGIKSIELRDKAVDKVTEAKSSFNTVIDDNNNLFIESAKWYLALCYIKTQDNATASGLLVSIRNEGGLYSNAAKKILKKIR